MDLSRVIRDNRATIVCGVIVATLLCAAALAFAPSGTQEDLVARVHDSDGRVYDLPLEQDATLTVSTSLGTNVVAVRDHAVFMQDADCPQRTCCQATALAEPGGQIICLPHQLWIEVVPKGAQDGQMDVSLATQIDESDGIDLQAR